MNNKITSQENKILSTSINNHHNIFVISASIDSPQMVMESKMEPISYLQCKRSVIIEVELREFEKKNISY